MTRIMVRVKDYFQMGVPVCWIIDPAVGSGWVATPGNLAEAVDGILRAGDIEMSLAGSCSKRPSRRSRAGPVHFHPPEGR